MNAIARIARGAIVIGACIAIGYVWYLIASVIFVVNPVAAGIIAVVAAALVWLAGGDGDGEDDEK
ncbi:hypothetical protein [Paenibacillus sp. P22]|uniref:hypothetical protein n=1 Tax=Paenibacillus sp. P22 TaxID=483908 RepID=UPI00038FD54F|nr:hypothetical protein [Paenibacillus sp. P22]CDN42043.1 hypothetical protein BN871_AT_00450 [Paenibacillus sp. P22]